MKLTAQMMFWSALVFAALCLSYALFGFSSIDVDMTAQQQQDARGFAGFWTFLGVIGIVLAIVSRFMLRDTSGREDE